MLYSSPQGQYYERHRPVDHTLSLDRAKTYEPSHIDRSERPRSLEPPRHLDVSHSPHRYELLHNTTPQRETMTKMFEPPVLRVETPDNLSMSSLSPNKKRNRPGPIVIPAAVNNRVYPNSKSPVKNIQNIAKVIYTPPAMLSPRSIFFNPPVAIPRALPSTPGGRYLLSIRRNSKCYYLFVWCLILKTLFTVVITMFYLLSWPHWIITILFVLGSIDQRDVPLPTSVSSDEPVPPELPEP